MGIITSKESAPKWFDDFTEQLPDLKGKVIAVTGCTTGLGFIFARTCVQKHAAAVILLNRASERAEAAEQSLKEIASPETTVVTITCDLQDFASVRKAAARIQEDYDALDVLCNNAGIMAFPDQATADGYDVQMQTNFLSHFSLTRELFPLLQNAKTRHGSSARIVNHSSFVRLRPNTPFNKKYLEKKGGDLGGSGSMAMWERYHQSKLAVAIFASALHDRLKGSGIEVTVAAPGYSYTDLQSSSPGMSGFLWSRAFMAQSVADGCMPLLSAAFLPSSSTEDTKKIWEPRRFRMSGPAVEYDLEEMFTKKEDQDTLWAASEDACGKFNL
jgi:NAD(P)-dependent dehydrogenase (short-subunit alcohol dehydrogenase family)